ncbi:hypothetical protein MPSEU_001047200 [Mayamaea pseudoterrestris]|nr:hypothetical protein MPSEU_001047200 [Mayamaea pseudoterrestris]
MTVPTHNSSRSNSLVERCDSETRGRHLRAIKRIDRGRLLWCERPLLCLQSRDNLRHAFVCSYCHAFMGGPNVAMSKRFADVKAETNTAVTDDANGNDNHQYDADSSRSFHYIPCRHKCGHYYCSDDCEEKAWMLHHFVFCTGRFDTLEHPIVVFKQWAVASNEILLLAAEWWVAQHVTSMAAAAAASGEESYYGVDGAGADDANSDENSPWRRRPTDYSDFSMVPWWDVETAPLRAQPGGFIEAAALETTLRELCETAAKLLNEVFDAYNRDNQSQKDAFQCVIPPISALDIAKRVGSFSQNAMGIRQRHPLCRDVFERSFREQWHDEIVAALAEADFIGDGSGENGCCNDDDETEEKDKASGNSRDEAETMNDGILPSAKSNDASHIAPDEWDYSVDEIAAFLSRLFVDEDGTVRDVDQQSNDEEDGQERDATGDDLDYIFSPLDGTAMYSLICKMNHSCDPNVIVLYKRTAYGSSHPLTAFAVALKPIEANEELTISYIDKSEPLATRQESLANYGFSCRCTKCEAETLGEMLDKEQVADPTDDLFGERDSDEDNSDYDKVGDDVDDTTSEAKLEQIAAQLDTRANHCKLGSMPLHKFARAFSYAISCARKLSKSVDDATICHLLDSLVMGLEMKDFCLCEIVGNDLEQQLYATLRRNKSWPSSMHREAYWCAVLGSAIGSAHNCQFLEALSFLDKGIILGLPCDSTQLRELYRYVELHACQMAQGPCLLFRNNIVSNFSMPLHKELLLEKGLSKPLHNPIAERNESMSFEAFHNEFAMNQKAVVMRDFAGSWRATEKWRNLGWLAHVHGGRLVPVELGSMLAGTMKEEMLTFRQFIKKYMIDEKSKRIWSLDDAVDPLSHVAYVAQHPLLNQITSLKDDLDMSPSIIGPSGPTHVYLWIGTGGTRTPLHFDSYDNLFVQLVGAKYVRLYSANETSKLYVNKQCAYGLQGNMSDVDCEREDFDKHPLAREAAFEEVLLLPGDALFIPARTWHYVRSLTTSISVNYWF